jgi:hypothetical protein
LPNCGARAQRHVRAGPHRHPSSLTRTTPYPRHSHTPVTRIRRIHVDVRLGPGASRTHPIPASGHPGPAGRARARARGQTSSGEGGHGGEGGHKAIIGPGPRRRAERRRANRMPPVGRRLPPPPSSPSLAPRRPSPALRAGALRAGALPAFSPWRGWPGGPPSRPGAAGAAWCCRRYLLLLLPFALAAAAAARGAVPFLLAAMQLPSQARRRDAAVIPGGTGTRVERVERLRNGTPASSLAHLRKAGSLSSATDQKSSGQRPIF